jgi:hypothetical protein
MESQPITFLAEYTPATPCPSAQPCKDCSLKASCYDENFLVRRLTLPTQSSFGEALTDTEWFDQELSNFGHELFLESCKLIDDVKKYGKIKATITMSSIRAMDNESWGIEFKVLNIQPIQETA